MSKRVTLDDDELELIVKWLEGVANPANLSSHYYTRKWSELAVNRLLKKLKKAAPTTARGER